MALTTYKVNNIYRNYNVYATENIPHNAFLARNVGNVNVIINQAITLKPGEFYSYGHNTGEINTGETIIDTNGSGLVQCIYTIYV